MKNDLMNDIDISNLSFKKLIGNDYCIISLRKENIIISYFRFIDKKKFNICQVNFISSSSNLLFDLINKHHLLVKSISLSHALYIGKEIYKAELSKILLQEYIQS